MFNHAARAARAVRPPPRLTLAHASRRWSSTQTSTSTSKLAWGAGALAVAGAGVYLASPAPSSAVSSKAPRIAPAASEDDIPVVSPVPVLDLAAANAKLRGDAHSFSFESSGGAAGRVDVVRLASNDPVEDQFDVAVGKGVEGDNTLYAGVYDGHAGSATAVLLKQTLIPYVSAALCSLAHSTPGELVDAAIKNAFSRLDDRIVNTARAAVDAGHDPGSAHVVAALMPAAAGSCALLSVYSPQSSVLRTAVTGDSRAVLGSWSPTAHKFEADALSVDQTGHNSAEVARLGEEHPGEISDIIDAESGRLLGLAVTRAFGGNRWKWAADVLLRAQTDFYGYRPVAKNATPPYLTARPEVTTRTVKTEDFAILASDGLWDVLSNEDAVECVSRWLAAQRAGRPESAADAKGVAAIDKDGWATSKATPDLFAIEDLDNAAVCLVKNALGGRRRTMFCGAMTVPAPSVRKVRDDITVQVIFFRDPARA